MEKIVPENNIRDFNYLLNYYGFNNINKYCIRIYGYGNSWFSNTGDFYFCNMFTINYKNKENREFSKIIELLNHLIK